MLEDCCASYRPEFHTAAVQMISAQGGIFGSVTKSTEFIEKVDGPSTSSSSPSGSDNEVVDTPAGTSSDPSSNIERPLSNQNNTAISIDANPYVWPYNKNMTRQNTCIIVIDMQVDFCAKYVYIDCFVLLLLLLLLSWGVSFVKTDDEIKILTTLYYYYYYLSHTEVDTLIRWDMMSN
jgi:hypothetical protein